MKLRMKLRKISSPLRFMMLATAAFGVSRAVLAGSFSTSVSAPTVDGPDLAQMLHSEGASASVKWWQGSPNPGQTFTTGDSPVRIKSFSLFSSKSGDQQGQTFQFTLRLSTVQGTNLNPVASELISVQDPVWTNNSWFTWTFDAPVALEQNTTYAVHVELNTGSAPWQNGMPYMWCQTSDVFAGGNRIFVMTGESAMCQNLTAEDYAFHLDLEANETLKAAKDRIFGR